MINIIDVQPRCHQDGRCFPHPQVKDCIDCAMSKLEVIPSNLADLISDLKSLSGCLRVFDEFGRFADAIDHLEKCRNLLWCILYNVLCQLLNREGDNNGNA